MNGYDDIDAMDELVGIERRLRGLAWSTTLAADYEELTPAGSVCRLASYVLHDDADTIRSIIDARNAASNSEAGEKGAEDGTGGGEA